jgi:hypothetical protein
VCAGEPVIFCTVCVVRSGAATNRAHVSSALSANASSPNAAISPGRRAERNGGDVALVDQGPRGGAVGPADHVPRMDLRCPYQRVLREPCGTQEREFCGRAFDQSLETRPEPARVIRRGIGREIDNVPHPLGDCVDDTRREFLGCALRGKRLSDSWATSSRPTVPVAPAIRIGFGLMYLRLPRCIDRETRPSMSHFEHRLDLYESFWLRRPSYVCLGTTVEQHGEAPS